MSEYDEYVCPKVMTSKDFISFPAPPPPRSDPCPESDQHETVYASKHDKLFRSAFVPSDVRLTGLAVHSRHLAPCSAGFCVGLAGVEGLGGAGLADV